MPDRPEHERDEPGFLTRTLVDAAKFTPLPGFLLPTYRTDEELNPWGWATVEDRANAYGLASQQLRNDPLNMSLEAWFAIGQAQNDDEGRHFAIEEMQQSGLQYDLEYILSEDYIGLVIQEIMKIQTSSFEDQGIKFDDMDYSDTPVGQLTTSYTLGKDLSYSTTEQGRSSQFLNEYRSNVIKAGFIVGATVAIAPVGGSLAVSGLSASAKGIMLGATFLRGTRAGVWVANSLAPMGVNLENSIKIGRGIARWGPRAIGVAYVTNTTRGLIYVGSQDEEGLQELKESEDRAIIVAQLELQGIFEQPAGTAAGTAASPSDIMAGRVLFDSGDTVFVDADGNVMTFDEAVESVDGVEFAPTETTTTTTTTIPTSVTETRRPTGGSEASTRPTFRGAAGFESDVEGTNAPAKNPAWLTSAYEGASPDGVTQAVVSVPTPDTSKAADTPLFNDRGGPVEGEPAPNQAAGVQESDDDGPGVTPADLDAAAGRGVEDEEEENLDPYFNNQFLGVGRDYLRVSDNYRSATSYSPDGRFIGDDAGRDDFSVSTGVRLDDAPDLYGKPVYHEDSVGDEIASWSYMQVLDFQRAAVASGLISPERQISGVPFFPGVLDGQTIEALQGAMTQANINGNDQTYWDAMEAMTESRERAKAIYGDGRVPPTWVAPQYFAPDYATISQGVKTLFTQGLGRAPNDWEMELLADSFRADSRAEFNEETLEPARRTYQRDLDKFNAEGDEDFDFDAFEAQGRVSEPGDIDIPLPEDAVPDGIDIDPRNRMFENFDKQFADELSAKDRWAAVQSQTGNLFASLNRLGNP